METDDDSYIKPYGTFIRDDQCPGDSPFEQNLRYTRPQTEVQRSLFQRSWPSVLILVTILGAAAIAVQSHAVFGSMSESDDFVVTEENSEKYLSQDSPSSEDRRKSKEGDWKRSQDIEEHQEEDLVEETKPVPVPQAEGWWHDPTKLDQKPHIVLVMADDMGWNDVGYGSSDLKGASPNIDALAFSGVRLENFYSQHLCTPARAALLTGKYPVNLGLQHEEVITPMSPWGLNLTETLLPELLKQNGYRTHVVGKWHLGHYMWDYLPTSRGFDTFAGYLSDQMHYYNHTYPQKMNDMYFTDLMDATTGGFELEEGKSGVLSDILWREKIQELIFADIYSSKNPLFLYFASQTTHGPLDDIPDLRMFSGPQKKLLRTIHNEERRRFAKLLMVTDKTVETIQNALIEAGMWNSTIFIFTSDNGGCSLAGGYNSPLRGGKHFLFEGGIKVRSFVSGPAIPEKARGTKYLGLMHISDWFSTILEAAGKDVPEGLDSYRQWSYIVGDIEGCPRDEIIHNVDMWSFPTSGDTLSENTDGKPRGAIRKGDLKLITRTWPLGWFKPPTVNGTHAGHGNKGVEDCNAAPNQYNVSDWLFNITEDPYEERNLFHEPEYKDERDALVKYMDEITTKMVQPSWASPDPKSVDTWTQYKFVTPWLGVAIVDTGDTIVGGPMNILDMNTSR